MANCDFNDWNVYKNSQREREREENRASENVSIESRIVNCRGKFRTIGIQKLCLHFFCSTCSFSPFSLQNKCVLRKCISVAPPFRYGFSTRCVLTLVEAYFPYNSIRPLKLACSSEFHKIPFLYSWFRFSMLVSANAYAIWVFARQCSEKARDQVLTNDD